MIKLKVLIVSIVACSNSGMSFEDSTMEETGPRMPWAQHGWWLTAEDSNKVVLWITIYPIIQGHHANLKDSARGILWFRIFVQRWLLPRCRWNKTRKERRVWQLYVWTTHICWHIRRISTWWCGGWYGRERPEPRDWPFIDVDHDSYESVRGVRLFGTVEYSRVIEMLVFIYGIWIIII